MRKKVKINKEYLNDYTNLIYENQKANVIPNTFNIVLIIVYFIIYLKDVYYNFVLKLGHFCKRDIIIFS